MDKIKVLVAEDDPNLGTILKEYLELKGYEAELAKNGSIGLDLFVKGGFQFCILDVMMPIKDGFTLAKEIRKMDKAIPILFLTAKSMKADTLEGFKVGADDYVTKPFSMEELLLRMNAILRRSTNMKSVPKKTSFTIGKYKFDLDRQLLSHGESEVKLTSKESDLLGLLCVGGNEVTERVHALKMIWGDDSYFNARSMDVYITKLRKYLKADSSVEIVNVHGRGFKILGLEA
ncbi:MAG: response regulator transcription factor [Flavobacteriales bacterium]|nr:response regulator transcription factor [Flavobacteriales bacterium]